MTETHPAPCRRDALWRGLWFAYVAALLFLALGPVVVVPGFRHGDKVLHLAAFTMLGLAWPWPLRWDRLWIPAALAVALPALIEFGQEFAQDYGRRPDIFDFLVGLLGGVLGLGVRLALLRRDEARRGGAARP